MNAKTTEKPKENRQAIIWGRFSSSQQSEGDSKDSQDRYNHQCAERNNINVIAEYFDEAVSVKTGVTPKFKKILKELPTGIGIICRDLDRINRGHSIDAQYFLFHEVIEKGHFVITSTDNIEYNEETIKQASTLIVGGMKTTIAYGENEKRIRGVRDAKASAIQLARESKPAPLGAWLPAHIKYNFETHQYEPRKDKLGNLIADIVKRIFSEYFGGKGVGGKGASSIAQRLNKDGIPTFHSKVAGQWSRGTICQLLRYEGVIGTLNINGERIPNAVPPAITEKLFYEVQKLIEASRGQVKQDKNGNKVFDKKGKPVLINGRHGNYNGENVLNVFRGLCHCVHCGGALKVYGYGKKTHYLGCVGYRDKRLGTDGKPCPAGDFVPFKEIERELIKWFIPQAKKALLGEDDTGTLIDTLTAKKNALQPRIQQTLDLLDAGYAYNEVTARLAKLEAERTQLEADIATAKAKQSSKATLPETIKELETISEKAIDGDSETRKRVSALVPTLVKDIKVDLASQNPAFVFELVDGFNIGWTLNKETGKGMAMTYFGKGTNWKKQGYKLSKVTLPKP